MGFIDKTFFTEKITAINLTKIIHRVIISIDFRVTHTIIIITAPIAINLTPRPLIASLSSFYPTNPRRKAAS
jgi:hypothetical protein